MIGPVFQLEWLRAGARGKHHRLRLVIFGVLLCETLLAAAFLMVRRALATPLQERQLAGVFLDLLVVYQFLPFIFYGLPVLAAGSIVDEKTRGTMLLLLTTPLSSLEIIVGKWLAQLSIGLTLALPAVPLITYFGLLAGWTAPALFPLAAVTLLVAMLGTAVGILAAVWFRRTWSAVLFTYGIYLLAAIISSQARAPTSLTPRFYWTLQPDTLSAPGVLSATIGCGVTMLLLLLAGWRLRPAYVKQQQGRTGPRWWSVWLRRPSVSQGQPVRWKERFAGELGMLSFVRALPAHWSKAGVLVLTALGSALTVLVSEGMFLMQTCLFMLIVSLTVGIRASAVISGERERQTWEALLSTPLTSYDMIRGKLWGIIDSARPYLMAYVVPAAVAACFVGPMAVVWTVYWWAATWILLYFLGAVGVRASAQCSNSWQSLVKTLTSAGGMILQRWFFVLVPLLSFMTFAVTSVFGPGGVAFATMSPVVFAGFMFIIGLFFMVLFAKTEEVLQQAEQRIEEERIPDNQLRSIRRFAQTGKWPPPSEQDERSPFLSGMTSRERG